MVKSLLLLWFGLILLLASNGLSREIRGNLLLTGSQVMTIEGDHVKVYGAITLRDSAVLLLRDSTVEIVQFYHEQYPIELQGQAQLVVENTALTSQYMFSILLWGRSSLLMTRTDAPQAVVTLTESARVDVLESTIRMFSAEPTVFPFTPQSGLATARLKSTNIYNVGLGVAGTANITIRGLKAADRWWLPAVAAMDAPTQSLSIGPKDYKSGRAEYDLQLDKCTIRNFLFTAAGQAVVYLEGAEIFQLGVYDSAKLVAENCYVNQVVLRLGRPQPIDVSFGNLNTGWHDNWVLSANRGNLPCSLVLRQTYLVDGWYLRLNGGRYHVFNSIISRLRAEFDTPDSYYHIENCYIREWMIWWNKGTLFFANCVIERVFHPDDSSITVRGSFSIINQVLDSQWGGWRNNATIIRWFPVQLYREDGSPLSNTEVQLLDTAGHIIHVAYTDEAGLANPGLRVLFDQTNYSQQFKVFVPSTGQSQIISLLSTTPITLPARFFQPPQLRVRR